MTGTTRRWLLAGPAFLAAGLLAPALDAFAQAYPARPVRIVVPYTPGGITDVVTRMVGEQLSAALGQPVVIENKPGANSIVGADSVAKSPADGYTLGMVIGAHAGNATLYAGRLPFDVVNDFTPISLVGTTPLVMATSAKLPATTWAEFLAYAKANPGKLNFGSSGVGAAAHLTMENLKRRAGIEMVHVPYRGTGPALTDLMSGQIGALMDTLSSLKPQIDAGAIRGIAVTDTKRSAYAPEVPTFAEAGLPDFVSGTWTLLLAPANLPAPILERLSTEIVRIVKSPALKAKLDALGIEPVGNSPVEATAFLKAEVAKWGDVIRAANVRLE